MVKMKVRTNVQRRTIPVNDTENKKIVPKISGIAYTGGKMNISGWKYPVVVDLDGLKINSGHHEQNGLPLLINHENRTGSRIGLIHAKRNGNVLSIERPGLETGVDISGIGHMVECVILSAQHMI